MLNFKQFLENRAKGRSLPETGYEFRHAKIYRATKASETTFKPMDYVSLSLKFTRGHAEHQAAVDGEPYHVIAAMVPASTVFEAYNPGEFFYDGPEVSGKQVSGTLVQP